MSPDDTHVAWRLLVTPPAQGAWNMACDHALTQAVGGGKSPPVLRFFGWEPPAVSVGRNQPVRGREAAIRELRRRGYDVVRRPTGGAAVLHADEVTYSVAIPLDAPLAERGLRAACARIHAAILVGLRLLGIEGLSLQGLDPGRIGGDGAGWSEAARGHERASGRAPVGRAPRQARPIVVGGAAVRQAGPAPASVGSCFAAASRSEVVWRDRKLVGSAQRRLGRAILQHGSILLSGDQAVLRVLWPESPAGERLATLDEAGGRRFGFDEVAAAVRRGFERELNVDLADGTLDPAEAWGVESLVGARYAREDDLFRL